MADPVFWRSVSSFRDHLRKAVQSLDSAYPYSYDGDMEMYQKISLIVAFSAVGIVVIYLYYKNIREFYRLRRRDKEAEAVILSRFKIARTGYAFCRIAQTTGVSRYGDGMIKVKLELDVYPGGLTHYITEVPWIINWMSLHNLQTGIELPVRIDAEDKNLVYPEVSWAAFDITEEIPLVVQSSPKPE